MGYDQDMRDLKKEPIPSIELTYNDIIDLQGCILCTISFIRGKRLQSEIERLQKLNDRLEKELKRLTNA